MNSSHPNYLHYVSICDLFAFSHIYVGSQIDLLVFAFGHIYVRSQIDISSCDAYHAFKASIQ